MEADKSIVRLSIDEQRAIVESVLDMDSELATIIRRSDRSRALKQGMMD